MVACKVCNKLTDKCCHGSEPECERWECCDTILCLCDGLDIIEMESTE